MSLIGTAIGALVALLPPALLHPKGDKPKPYVSDDPLIAFTVRLETEVSRLRCDNDRLTRSHARLVDHIETLEREFLIEQHLCTHWKAEAERLAKHAVASRERAEALERDRQDVRYQALLAQSQNPPPTPSWGDMNGRSAMAYAQQQNLALAQQHQLANQQAQFAQCANQGLQWRGDYDGFCNCVPSRAQVWGEESRDLERRLAHLNQGEG